MDLVLSVIDQALSCDKYVPLLSSPYSALFLLIVRLSDGGGTFVSGAASHSFGQAVGETPTILNRESCVQKSVVSPIIDFLDKQLVS